MTTTNSLPEPSARRHMHTRRIQCEGYVRDDGLWDVEARMIDSKHYAYTETYRGLRGPQDSVHDMSVRLTFDDTLTVKAVAVAMPSTPYESCTGAAPRYEGLIGLQVGPQWRAGVNRCVGGTLGCTHLRELLFPMATVAFQAVFGWPEDEPPAGRPGLTHRLLTGDVKPPFLNGCHAWASNGPVVADQYPQYATSEAVPVGKPRSSR